MGFDQSSAVNYKLKSSSRSPYDQHVSKNSFITWPWDEMSYNLIAKYINQVTR